MSDIEDETCQECGFAECRCDEMDDDDRECFHCGGEGYHDCPDPIECTSPHLGGQYRDGIENHRCDSCGGSGRAKDMTIW
jgi:hypothetical protein